MNPFSERRDPFSERRDLFSERERKFEFQVFNSPLEGGQGDVFFVRSLKFEVPGSEFWVKIETSLRIPPQRDEAICNFRVEYPFYRLPA
jgi:hypothetical protein